jgi:hypothetical protein
MGCSGGVGRPGKRGEGGRGEEAYIVFITEFFAERSAHDCAADAGGGTEVGFSGFSARARQTCRGSC